MRFEVSMGANWWGQLLFQTITGGGN